MSVLRRRQARRGGPLVERIAGWSARHAKTAVIGWFVLVRFAFLAGQLLGTQRLRNTTRARPGSPSRPCTG